MKYGKRTAFTTGNAIPGLGRNLILSGLLVTAGVVAPLATSAQSATPVVAPYAGSPSTAILVTSTNDPRAVLGSDGMRHLEYDLIVTNTYVAPVQLSIVEVSTPDGAVLLTLEGDDLLNATQPLLGSAPQQEIPASAAVAIVMDVIVPPDAAYDGLHHSLTYTVPADAPDQALIGSLQTDGPTLPISPIETIVIESPLAGDGWLALNGCCAASSVHRFERVAAAGASFAKAEMFAIDWMQMEDGFLNTDDGSRVGDYFGYGDEVRAAAAGTVVYTRDDMPDQVAGAQVTGLERPEDFGGNQIMVEIAPGIYAWYAHLLPGSVSVSVGDQVTAGQPIAKLGNSGNSTAPHLHFGLLDAPNSTTGNGVPLALSEYELVGMVAPESLTSPSADGRLPIDASLQGTQQGTLPLYLSVIDLPE